MDKDREIEQAKEIGALVEKINNVDSNITKLETQIHSYRNDVKIREEHLIKSRKEDKEDYLRLLDKMSETFNLTIKNATSDLQGHTNKVSGFQRAEMLDLKEKVNETKSEIKEDVRMELGKLKGKVSKLNIAYLMALGGGGVIFFLLANEKIIKLLASVAK